MITVILTQLSCSHIYRITRDATANVIDCDNAELVYHVRI